MRLELLDLAGKCWGQTFLSHFNRRLPSFGKHVNVSAKRETIKLKKQMTKNTILTEELRIYSMETEAFQIKWILSDGGNQQRKY
jgi:hypothetical protein